MSLFMGIIMVAVVLYIVLVEHPRYTRQRDQHLRETGYGFLLDDEKKDRANSTNAIE